MRLYNHCYGDSSSYYKASDMQYTGSVRKSCKQGKKTIIVIIIINVITVSTGIKQQCKL